MNERADRRLRELRATRALVGLPLDDEKELRRGSRGAADGPDEYELAAAAIYLALSESPEPMPERLRRRLDATPFLEPDPPA